MAASDAGSAAPGLPEVENCSEIRLLLSALVDNEASPEEAVRAKNHLLICSACASHLAFLRLTGRALSQVPEVYPSASLSARIAAATYERPTLAERIAGWLRPAPVRVVIGAAMAAGLALVLIVPRMGGEVATGTSPSSAAPKDKAAAKQRVAKSVKPAAPVPVAAKPQVKQSKTQAWSALAMALPSPPAAASVPAKASAPPEREMAPVKVASALPSAKNLAMMAHAGMSAGAILQGPRTDPRIDRRNTLRTAIPTPLKNTALATPVFPRSGYDRAAATEQVLKPRVADAAAQIAALPMASAVTPNLSPLVPEGSAGKLAEPGSAAVERIGSRTPSASTAVSVAAAEVPASPSGEKVQFHLNNKRPSNTTVFTFPGANQQGAGSLSPSGNYSFANSSSSRMSVTSAPVTGMNH